MTAQVISIRPQSVNALAAQAKAAWDRADLKQDDADEWKIRTGKVLINLRTACEASEISFTAALKKIGRSRSRAYELIDLAEAKTTAKQQRERTNKRLKKHRANRPLRNGRSSGGKATGDKSKPLNQQVNALTRELTELIGDWCARLAVFWRENPNLKSEYRRSIEDHLNMCANRLQITIQTIEGR